MKKFEIGFENTLLVGKKHYITVIDEIVEIEATDRFNAMIQVKKEYKNKTINYIKEKS